MQFFYFNHQCKNEAVNRIVRFSKFFLRYHERICRCFGCDMRERTRDNLRGFGLSLDGTADY